MSCYKQYPIYNDSGVEWLGKLPEHWEIKPLFSVAVERKESNKGMIEDNLLSLSYGTIVKKDINTNEGLLPKSFETYQIVKPGDIIFRLTDLQNDRRSLRTAIVTEVGIITSAYVAVSAKGIVPAYLNFLLRAYDIQKVFYSMGGGMRQSMQFEDLRRLPILIPTRKEQEIICEKLDRETAHIDALIEKKKRYSELLKERRRALVTCAVIKGLDPNVKMKDSGVEWLGQIPQHWEIQKLKWIASLQSGSLITGQTIEEEGPYPVYGGNGLRGFTTFYTHEGYYVLVGRQGALCGNINYAQGRFWASEHAVVVSPYKEINVTWLGELLKIMNLNQYSVSAAQPGLAVERIVDLYIPLPRMNEQNDIAIYIERNIVHINRVIQNNQQSIELLKERRIALITVAVTGQIDLREANT